MLKSLLLLLLNSFASLAAAQGVATAADIRRITDTAMVKVGAGDIEGGLLILRPHVAIPEAEFDAMLGQSKLQVPLIAARFGTTLGHEFIREDRLGESFMRVIYVHRFEKHAMRWMFFCYRAKSGWIVNTFRFDDRWHELFSAP